MRRVAALVVALVLGAGCGGAGADAERARVPGKRIAAVDPKLVPVKVLDLDVKVEDVKKRLAKEDTTYVEALTLFSLRRDDELMATLQVTRLNDEARVRDPGFRRSFVNTVGATEPRQLKLGKQRVSSTTGNEQRLSIWFKDRHVFVLAVRKTYEHPRRLLRSMLEVKP